MWTFFRWETAEPKILCWSLTSVFLSYFTSNSAATKMTFFATQVNSCHFSASDVAIASHLPRGKPMPLPCQSFLDRASPSTSWPHLLALLVYSAPRRVVPWWTWSMKICPHAGASLLTASLSRGSHYQTLLPNCIKVSLMTNPSFVV